MMMALKEMNRRWQQHAVEVCGQPVHALTYQIFPIGSSGGLIEAVLGCRTLRELKKLCREPQERVYEALGGESQKLDTLAASTTAYLTACYALGVRDGHDDNIMLREDGSLFRVDFGFVFGATPEIDTPQTVVARAVTFALGERWLEVVAACGDSLTALTGDSYGSPPAFDCLSSVPELEAYLPLARVLVQRNLWDIFVGRKALLPNFAREKRTFLCLGGLRFRCCSSFDTTAFATKTKDHIRLP
ncbi:Phosphatidylinositol 3-kinase age-1 (PI3-kinase age-1) (PI3K age-1) (PtdIns-3-kinase age-1) (Aging alteration protein 1) [Durusdinium trenchii]|uniref:Phosphatidylinositol 3-kinase age-1 (PI3-kinase age-1) (PI3K age-1) (PtdIns-3-kinase age-1) (Aging alteration protein 1) n=1 Tax=Durusdinium trenchii TaxID=1381693 RepID=A0ABP0SM73_9DINO